jgi:uncharacterized NAD-dependent epimerase/dehydratase family protein
VPRIADVIAQTMALGRLTNPAIRCVGIALNTSKIAASAREAVLRRYARETGLPCVDALADGVGPIVERLLEEFPA